MATLPQSCTSLMVASTTTRIIKFHNPKSFTHTITPYYKNLSIQSPIRITIPKATNSSDKPFNEPNIMSSTTNNDSDHNNLLTKKLYAILEAIYDRIEMHQNLAIQRGNWNSLLLTSLNMITLTASAMATGLAGGTHDQGPFLALKVSSTLLFLGATMILAIMNKIQPSQLAEEQRNSVRRFRQLQTRIQTQLALGPAPTEGDIEETLEKVLALDRAYPLPLLGAMLDKFPNAFRPAVWWAPAHSGKPSASAIIAQIEAKSGSHINNGWSEELEEEMREIVGVIRKKDMQDFDRLGNKALRLNKKLATWGPRLTGIAAAGSAFAGWVGPWAGLVAATAGSMASVANTLEHGGQVGMVFEIYRNCAGFFKHLEETIEGTLEERDVGRRENGELFELNMALRLGRSLPELRELATKAMSSKSDGSSIDECASKLF